jgi:hypothetical protein
MRGIGDLACGLLLAAYLIGAVVMAVVRDARRPRHRLDDLADPHADCGDLPQDKTEEP